MSIVRREKTPELIFEILAAHWALESARGKLLRGPVAGLAHGESTPVVATEAGAVAYAERLLADRALRRRLARLTPVAVGKPFDFMRRAAREGSCGICVLGEAGGARRFAFTRAAANRRAKLPTHLTAIARFDFAGLSLGKDAIESIPLGELVYFDGKRFLDHPTVVARSRAAGTD